jgi:hypothetical protein
LFASLNIDPSTPTHKRVFQQSRSSGSQNRGEGAQICFPFRQVLRPSPPIILKCLSRRQRERVTCRHRSRSSHLSQPLHLDSVARTLIVASCFAPASGV